MNKGLSLADTMRAMTAPDGCAVLDLASGIDAVISRAQAEIAAGRTVTFGHIEVVRSGRSTAVYDGEALLGTHEGGDDGAHAALCDVIVMGMGGVRPAPPPTAEHDHLGLTYPAEALRAAYESGRRDGIAQERRGRR